MIADRLATLGLCEWGAPLTLTDAEVEAFVTSRSHEGLVCLLGAAVERGFVEVSSAAAGQLTTAWAEVMASAVQLDALLLRVTSALAAARIDSRVLKGVANASLDEFDPSWRSYNDVDVLVPADSLVAAADALATIGLRPIAAPVGRRWARSNAKSVTLQHESGMQVDVHRMLAAGPFGSRVRSECLFGPGRRFEVGGVQLTALSDAHRFFHACYHATLGGAPGARHRRDVLLLASATAPTVIESTLGDGWSPAVIAAALRWANEDVDVLSAEWLNWLAATRFSADDQALLKSYGGSFREIARAELKATRGLMAKISYATALVWPSSANLAARGKSRWQHLRGLVVRP